MWKSPKEMVLLFSSIIFPVIILLTSSGLLKFYQEADGDYGQILSIKSVRFWPLSDISTIQSEASASKGCTIKTNSIKLDGTPQQSDWGSFVDNMPNRSDLRSDTSNGLVEKGVPLRLIIRVYDADDGECLPLVGAKVDIWSPNSQGSYSGIKSMQTSGMNFLRGNQLTDSSGTVEFITIFPGWYEGRTIHIHDKVRTFEGSQTTTEWTSQLYFDDSINQKIHQDATYRNSGPPPITNKEDLVFSSASPDGVVEKNSGERLVVNLTKQGSIYVGTFNIVLKTAHK